MVARGIGFKSGAGLRRKPAAPGTERRDSSSNASV
jgi:hypothetical protein